MRSSVLKRNAWLITLLVLLGCVLVSSTALASTGGGAIGGGGGLSAGGGADFGAMLDSMLDWLKERLHLVLTFAGIGICLILAFNQNYGQMAEKAAYFGLIGTLLAFVLAGFGASSASGALLP